MVRLRPAAAREDVEGEPMDVDVSLGFLWANLSIRVERNMVIVLIGVVG